MSDAVVAVVGGGQLGRMLALAAAPLGVRCRFLDPARDATAGTLGHLEVAAYDDVQAIDRIARGATALTYEFENVAGDALEYGASGVPIRPPVRALAASQDRLAEKLCFQQLGIETAPTVAVSTQSELRDAADRLGYPCVLKTRRMGYDGKGQFVLREPSEVTRAWEAVGSDALIVEGFVDFDRELSIIAARGVDGAMAIYPLTENVHRAGILRRSTAPAVVSAPLVQGAESLIRRVMDSLEYVGVLAIELFERKGSLLANEMAPRVHNSGHWTIDGAVTSQFENHIRAVVGLPLGDPSARGHSVMLNIIGEAPRSEEVLEVRGAHLHLYGKAPRAGRKLGHVTIVGDDARDVAVRAAQVGELLPPSG